MTPQSERRLELAHRVVDALARRTRLRATLIAGSVALGISDDHSDIDLLNFYDTLPDQPDFDAALREAGAEPKGQISPPGPDGFLGRYEIGGIELQTGAELVSSLERSLDRIAAGDVDWAVAKTAMGLREGIGLHGDDLVAGWKRRAAYPDALRRREVERNLGVFPIWRLDGHLAARDANLFRRQMLVEGAFRVVSVLSAVNGVFFSTFQFKRARAHFAQLDVKPERLAERIDLVANAVPSVAAEELRRLVEDTKAIVRQEMPGVETEVPWQPAVDE